MSRKSKNVLDLSSIIKQVKEKNKMETLDVLDEFKEVKNWISSGVPDIDWLMNTPGFNPGIIEVAGKSRSGKTTLMFHVAKEVLKQNGIFAVMSTERRVSLENVKRMNIDPTKILIRKCKTIENIFDESVEFIQQVRDIDETIPIFIGVDSLGGTPTKAEMKAKPDDEFMAIAARVIKGRLRRITQIIDDRNIIFYVNNQMYSKIGVSFGKKTKSYGGEGLQFFRQLGLEVVKLSTIKLRDKKVGQVSRFELTKSDFTLPEQYCDIELLWGYGFIPSKRILELGVERGILDNYGKGGYASIKNPNLLSWKSTPEYYELMRNTNARDYLNLILLKAVHSEIKELRG